MRYGLVYYSFFGTVLYFRKITHFMFLLPTRYYLTGDRFALPMTIDSRSKQTKTGVSLFRCVLFLLRILGSSNFKMFLSKVRTMHSAIIEILVDSLNAFVYKSFNVANNRNR